MFQRLWHFNVAAVLALIVIAWPSLWWVWLAPTRWRPRPPAVPAPVIRIIPADAVQPEGLWSPLLFSLPTLYGFSRTVQMEWLETRGVPVIPPMPPPLLTFRPEAHPLPAGALMDFTAPAQAALASYQPTQPPPIAPPAVPATAPLVIPSANLAAVRFALSENWETGLPEIPRPWSVTAVVELDETGAVRHVFIVAPHENVELNAAVNRILRRARAAPHPSAQAGPVSLAHP